MRAHNGDVYGLAATAWGPRYITGSSTGRLDHWGNTREDPISRWGLYTVVNILQGKCKFRSGTSHRVVHFWVYIQLRGGKGTHSIHSHFCKGN